MTPVQTRPLIRQKLSPSVCSAVRFSALYQAQTLDAAIPPLHRRLITMESQHIGP